jgi:hypothetical protein
LSWSKDLLKFIYKLTIKIFFFYSQYLDISYFLGVIVKKGISNSIGCRSAVNENNRSFYIVKSTIEKKVLVNGYYLSSWQIPCILIPFLDKNGDQFFSHAKRCHFKHFLAPHDVSFVSPGNRLSQCAHATPFLSMKFPPPLPFWRKSIQP